MRIILTLMFRCVPSEQFITGPWIKKKWLQISDIGGFVRISVDEKGQGFKKSCDLPVVDLTYRCSSLVSEPAVTLLPLSTGIMCCRTDGGRGDTLHICVCVFSLQLVCGGKDASFKCCTSVCSPAAWEHTDHMHSNAGRAAVLTTGERPFGSAHLGWLGSWSLDSTERR